MLVHVNHLNHAVKEVTGKPTTVHIAERMLTEARTLLTHTARNTNDLAYSLRSEYANPLNPFFKYRTATTPGSFRNHILLDL